MLLLRTIVPRLVVILTSLFQAAFAQTYSWRTAETGGCGFVTGIAFHPTEAGLVYARTDVGGAYRLDNTTNRWIALNDDIGGINNEFQHQGVISVGLDPNDANRVYLATGQYSGTETWKLTSRIYRSTDRGNTWSYANTTFKMGGNEDGRGTGERLAVDPVNGANILVGTSDSGIWRSSDYGTSWTRMTALPSSLTRINFLIYAPSSHISPGSNRRLYASANTLTGQSFWFSDNNGTTWAEVPNHPGKTIGGEMMPLQGSFDAAGVFYITWANAPGPANGASRYGVWKLSADDTTWTSILPPTGQGFFSGISADPRVAGHVVVATLQRWWPADETYRSTDGGATWTAALTTGTRSAGNSPWSATGANPHWITDIEIDPFNSNRAIFNTGYGLFQTTKLSTAGTGRTWTFFNDGLEESVPLGLHSPTAGPPLVSVIGDYTGFRYDDLNRSPLRGSLSPSSGSTNVINGADLAPTEMIRQNGGTTLYSQDAAATWSSFTTTPPPTVNGQNRVILSTDGQRLLWCPPNSPAYLSTNKGATWTASTGSHSLSTSNGTETVALLAGAAGVPDVTNGNGGGARFNSPAAIALDSAGIRYVADTANHMIRKIAAGAAVTTLAGGAGVSGSTDATGVSARFNAPAGIAVDSANNVYVADTGNHTIRKITPAGVVTTFAGSPGVMGSTNATGTAARFKSPTRLAADKSGNLFVCDTGNHTIRKITNTGVVTTVAGNPGISGTTNANGANALFNSPQGIAVDTTGLLYVADSGNHSIRKIAGNGDVTTFAGLSGTSGTTDATGESARFNTPKGLTIDISGALHIADSGNQTIRKISSSGVVTTVAGLAGNSGTANGAGTTARFNNPTDIATTPDGINLYITDTANHTIRTNTIYNTLTPLADRVDGLRFYLWDNTAKRMLTSTDGGANFTQVASGMNGAFALFRTVPGNNGHIWVRAGNSGLYRSTNFGATFAQLPSVAEVYQFDFGKAKPGNSHPAVFIWGKVGSTVGFFRSDDIGVSWTRINDNLHNFGYQNDIAGDPRVYGRVYLATSGRGVVIGEIANPAPPASQPSQMVYTDALSGGWSNVSPSGTSLTSSNPVRRGTTAVSISAGTGKGLSMTCPSRSLEGYIALSFWISAGTSAPPPLQIGSSRGGIALEAAPITYPTTVGWQRVIVPFSRIGISNITDLTGLRIESRTVNGVTPGAFSLDDVVLVGADELNSPSTATVTLANLTPFYDGAPKPVTVTTNPPGLGLTVTYNGSTTAPTSVGTYAVSAVVDDASLTGSASGSLVIAKAPQSITFAPLPGRTFGDSALTLAATSSSGLPVTFERISGPVLVSGNNVTLAGAGTAVIRASQSGSASYQPAQSIDQGFSISKATAAITLAGLAQTYDGSPKPLTYTTVPSSLQATLTYNGEPNAPTHAGSYAVTATINDANYEGTRSDTLVIIPAAQSITFGPLPDRTFGDSTFTLAATSSSGLPVSFERISGPATLSGNDVTLTGAGTVVVRASQPGSISYQPAQSIDQSFSISKATAAITLAGLAQTYDGSPKPLTYTTDPSSLQATLTYNGEPNAPTHPRSYAVTATINDANYQGTKSDTLVITPAAQSITFGPLPDRTIGDSTFTLAATSSSGLPVSFELISGPATLSGNDVTLTGAGNVVVRASQPGNDFYGPAPFVDQSIRITKALASINLDGLSQAYDGAPKPLIYTTVPASLPVIITYDGESTTPTTPGSYTVTATIDHPDYQGNESNTLVITRAVQSITFGPLPDRTFGEPAFNIAAISPSGLPVALERISGPATLAGNFVTLTGAGTVTLRATQSGDSFYLPAEIDQSFIVAKARASIILGNLNQVFDNQPKPVSAATTPSGLLVTVTYDGQATPPSAAGSYAVAADIDDANYQGTTTGTLVISNSTNAMADWRFEHFLTYDDAANAANSADPDHDDIENLMEFALGLDPNEPSIIPASLAIKGNELEYTYTRNKAATNSVSFHVEYSDTLHPDDWVLSSTQGAPMAVIDHGLTETIKVSIPIGNTGRFVHLKVTPISP